MINRLNKETYRLRSDHEAEIQTISGRLKELRRRSNNHRDTEGIETSDDGNAAKDYRDLLQNMKESFSLAIRDLNRKVSKVKSGQVLCCHF
jgi:uncharacterized membrane-anchored protein YhcB (DUF1043 family)